MRRFAFTFLVTLGWSGCTCASDVTIVPPRVPQGGRAVAVAVDMSDEQRLIVASESGGLFRTLDGGESFHHLAGFPTFAPVDVEIASLNHDVVIATARDDFRAISGGGIWRSIDGGGSWRRPNGWPPAADAGCRMRPEARGISHMPLSRTFHVATDCGIAVSTDDGATFSIRRLDPLAPPRFDSLQHRVRSLLVVNRALGVAADDRRIFFLSGGSWQQSTVAPDSGGAFAIHAFASPWWTNTPLFYHTARDGRVWFSDNGGSTWSRMDAPPWSMNREAFIRVGRALDGNDTHVDVYHGDGFTMRRQTVTTAVPGGSNQWKEPNKMDHRDPSDLAFTPDNTAPLMLTTDGGVHLTPDNGTTWALTASGYGGYAALQIGEITGRFVDGSPPHTDLYYGTQDNDIKGSSDGGKTWDGSICCEGAFLRGDAANPAHVDGEVTGRSCGGCRNFIVPPHVGQHNPPPSFLNAPTGSAANKADPPVQLVGATYLQEVPNTGQATFDYFLSPDRGTSWSPSFTISRRPRGPAQFAGSLDNPVAYIGVEGGGVTPALFGLIRAQDVGGQATVRPADANGMQSLGLLRTGQATYVVFGVDPASSDHLIAPDIVAGQMKASSDGGTNWYLLPQLTTAVTDTGKFLLARGERSFVTTIAWDPVNSCHILVGTMQNGILRSADGGLTWKQVAGSKAAPWISSFYFPPTGSIWMSSYGRGLWTVSVRRERPASGRCQFPPPPGPAAPFDSLIVVSVSPGAPPRPFGGLTDSLMCASCSLVAVTDGWVSDVQLDGDQLGGIDISNGSVLQVGRDGREVPLAVSNRYVPGEGAATLRRLAGRAIAPGQHVQGVIVDGTRLVALVLGREPIPLVEARTPRVVVLSAGRSMIPSVAESGDSVTVRGSEFVPGQGAAGVEIRFDDDVVATGVAVGADGRFAITLPLARPRGELEVTAEQRDGRRLTRVKTSIAVVGREG